jgi:hypothetical protein
MNRLSFILLFIPFVCFGQVHSVNSAEYFFDTDPGVGNGTPISVATDDTVAMSGMITTGGLSPGVHVLNVRVRRDDGFWSAPTRRMIRIGIGTSFSAAEAFFDSDPGEGSGTPVPITPQGTINESAFAIPALARGFHRANLRCYSGGTWSAPSARVLRLGSAILDGAEAYFDSDPGEGHGISVDVGTGADVTALDSSVSVAAACTGYHTLYLRFRGGGVWSFPKFQPLRIGPWVDGGSNRITGAEYFIDTDPGAGHGCALTAVDGNFDSGLEAVRSYVLGSTMGIGSHVIGMRIRDGGGRWQNTVRDTVTILQAHTVTTMLPDTAGGRLLVAWTTYPTATLYRVHYDSTVTGTYTSFFTVTPPDTSCRVTPDAARRYFKVYAVQPDPQPCSATRQ